MKVSCNFICESCKKTSADTHLRAQFIRGIKDAEIRERLLQQKPSEKCEEFLKITNSIDMSKHEASEMRRVQEVNVISRVMGADGKQRSEDNCRKNKLQDLWGKCFRCRKTNHKANNCFA